ncbi:MAG: 30S ribosomal protein S18 [Candidatus Marinimicrobia bacterium]|nr:30S ribosomal protein S18 [Candidatus Neomarinimicrobiota bacterium]
MCSFCVEHATHVDYKNVDLLHRYLSERARIDPRRKTGTCARHQRMLATALKRARHLALLPYTLEHRLQTRTFGPRRRT